MLFAASGVAIFCIHPFSPLFFQNFQKKKIIQCCESNVVRNFRKPWVYTEYVPFLLLLTLDGVRFWIRLFFAKTLDQDRNEKRVYTEYGYPRWVLEYLSAPPFFSVADVSRAPNCAAPQFCLEPIAVWPSAHAEACALREVRPAG